jgi:ribosome-associated toxin RatA of RatAB toxin-antitoxin module
MSTIYFVVKRSMAMNNKTHNVSRTVIVNHSAQTMFELVSDIDHYSHYLPWCTKSEIKNQYDNIVIGTIFIEYFKIKTSFVTKNINTPHDSIQMFLLEGPFEHLNGLWQFIPLGDKGCKIIFNLDYKFSNQVLEMLLSPVFNYICKTIVDCFIKQADIQHAR